MSGLLDLSLELAASAWSPAFLMQVSMSCQSSMLVKIGLGLRTGEGSGSSEGERPKATRLAGLSQRIDFREGSGVRHQII